VSKEFDPNSEIIRVSKLEWTDLNERMRQAANACGELRRSLSAALAAKELAEARSAIWKQSLDIVQDKLDWAAEGLDYVSKNKCRRVVDEARKLLANPDEAAAELLRDRARIDWLCDHALAEYNDIVSVKMRGWYSVSHEGIRAAIDAAMSSESLPPEERS